MRVNKANPTILEQRKIMTLKSDDEKLLEDILLKTHGLDQKLSSMFISKFSDDFDKLLDGPIAKIDHAPWKIESDIIEGQRRFCYLKGGNIFDKYSIFHI